MREQYPLFESEQRRWAQHVWLALGPELQHRDHRAAGPDGAGEGAQRASASSEGAR
jgi:hypothetical protein